MKPLLFCFILFVCCKSAVKKPLQVEAKAVDAATQGDLLKGPSVLQIDGYFVWGGSVVKGEDNKYHMLFSLWESGEDEPKFSDSWVLNSKIGYAVSDYPDHGFEFQKIVLRGRQLEGDSTAWDAQMVHNPHVQRFGDRYYLYYIGSVDPGEDAPGAEGINLRNRVQQNQKIGLIAFDSFDDLMAGNFIRPKEPLLSPRSRVKPDQLVNPSPEGTQTKPDNIIVVNPSVVQRPSDGKYLLYFKGNQYTPVWRGIHGVAIGDKPEGPFKALEDVVFEIRNQESQIASTEDPYVWYSKAYSLFFAVFKDFTGAVTGQEPGLALMQSEDGIKWQLAEKPFFMPKVVRLKNGKTLHVDRLERPQLLINGEGLPQALYSACAIVSVGQRNDGTSFNVQIPLEVLGE
ncbi:glycoside hydrolase family protein [Marinilongibacter aquaticus]|uniref:glycoside hydrolase family protein n=1 Tax=Marinilongibacter aquaticus TaxID=2975157 RepID=UPI0021BD83BE|nr:glycoside hydrolase family protein [Marinilongibacter aquaticus]UBM57566.1 glycoside hydrolase family protein [Marinilongibacter aquaticus]